MDIEVHGALRGDAASTVPPHEALIDGRILAAGDGRISVRWPHAPDESDASEAALHAWLEPFLLALSVTAGSALYVEWDGATLYQPDGRRRRRGSVSFKHGFVRQHPATFDLYADLASAIVAKPEVAEAAEHLRIALDLMSQGVEAAGSEVFRAVECLARGRQLAKWEGLGERLGQAGSNKRGDDLRSLWINLQQFRHKRLKRGYAGSKGVGRALNVAECCWLAAEILEAYVELPD